MNIDIMNTTELTDALDATGEPWNLWRAATDLFCVSRGEGRDDPAAREFSHATIDGVLRLALASKRLPVIPLRPTLCHYECIRMDGGPRPWKVLCDSEVIMNLRLKRDTVDRVEGYKFHQSQRIDAWIDQHAHYVDTHTERVDFYWAKR